MTNTEHEGSVTAKIKIPYGLDFDDLKLSVNEDDSVCYNGRAIARICQASGLEVSHFIDGPPENLLNMIEAWYTAHRKHGGQRNAAAEELFSEDDLHARDTRQVTPRENEANLFEGVSTSAVAFFPEDESQS